MMPRTSSQQPAPIAMIVSALPSHWRAEAERLRDLAAEGQARALERAARELEASLQAGAHEIVTLDVAANESGFSADHLGRLIRQGKLRNYGQKRTPRVRLADVPRKRARPSSLTLSSSEGSLPDAIARAAIGAKLTSARRT